VCACFLITQPQRWRVPHADSMRRHDRRLRLQRQRKPRSHPSPSASSGCRPNTRFRSTSTQRWRGWRPCWCVAAATRAALAARTPDC
jgi:hypothetical protein